MTNTLPEKNRISKKDFFTVCMIVLSAAIYAVGMNVFVKSGNLFPGGFSGISRLISLALYQFLNINISFSVIYFTLNIIITVFVYRRIGHKFVGLSILWFTLASIFTSLFPIVEITEDPLLIAIFGGLINGFAIGLSLRNNASSGGTDFIAIYISMRYNMPTWNYIMGANVCVLFLAGLMFGWNQALYSIIFQFVSTQVVNTLHQRYKLSKLEVVTNHPNEICSNIFHICHHGITKIPCEGGFTDKPHWLLVMTLNTYELKQVVEEIKRTDPHAFIAVNSVTKIVGNYYQQPLD